MAKKNVLKTLGEEERLLAYCFFQLEELKSKGLIEGGNHQLSKQGRKDIKELIDGGYAPDPTDYAEALHFIISGGDRPMPRLDS